MNCRHCGAALRHTFLDLGFAPPSTAYVTRADLARPERTYPLKIMVCDQCWLVQTEDYAAADELFNADYAYFSSTSSGWLAHAARYARDMIARFELGGDSFVLEVACNDGYLLKNFVAASIPCLGIEPTAGTAAAAERLGIPVRREFFGEGLGRQLAGAGQQADLIAGNNVYAHVPDINDFTQFDTVYHEHFSYLSLYTIAHIFTAAGLKVWDVEQLATHGGSLRVYGCHAEDSRAATAAVAALLDEEARHGLQSLDGYRGLQARADRLRDDLLEFLIAQKRAGKSVAAYGAAAKGNTLLNYAGVKADLVPFVCDAALAKQGKFLPGSHIPILPPSVLTERRPDYLLILPWNIADEIRQKNAGLAALGTRFVTAVPALAVS